MSHPDGDGGFTLIEVLMAMVLSGLMMALAIAGYSRWAAASAHVGTAREIQTTMRQAQQQAVTEGRATCVWFDVADHTYTVYRGACTLPTDTLPTDTLPTDTLPTKKKLKGPIHTASDDVGLSGPSFAGSPSTSVGVTFFARGTATPGGVSVTRSGSTKVYLLSVEGLTGRVSLV